MTARICEGCPFVRDCPDCMFRGGEPPPAQQQLLHRLPTPVAPTCENLTGNNERPTAPTVDRSSHSDSRTRKEGVGT